MIRMIFGLKDKFKYNDEPDALAIALCYMYRRQSPESRVESRESVEDLFK